MWQPPPPKKKTLHGCWQGRGRIGSKLYSIEAWEQWHYIGRHIEVSYNSLNSSWQLLLSVIALLTVQNLGCFILKVKKKEALTLLCSLRVSLMLFFYLQYDFQCLCLQNIQPSTSQMHKACHPSPQIDLFFFSPEPLFVICSVIS